MAAEKGFVSSAVGGLVKEVDPQGLAYRAGVLPGDRLVAINGHPLRDLIDYRYYSAEENLLIEIQRGDTSITIEIERGYGDFLGLTFEDDLFDGIRRCVNRCPFCFVAQMPPGMRPSLYVRDDDYRYSFLHGGYITLTNLTEEDWRRIEEQHLSPLYVSIHAVDLTVRRRMLGNPYAPDILEQLKRLGDMGIAVHGQVVIVPGMNDGVILGSTIERLLSLWPTVQSLALVPVGLTRFSSPGLRPFSREDALAVLELATNLDSRIRRHTGTTWLYPSDEIFILAGSDIPPASFYDDEAQYENGVGLVRTLLDDWQRVRRRLKRALQGRRAMLVCGTLIAPLLGRLVQETNAQSGAHLTLVSVENEWFGSTVTVSGLLTARDILKSLEGRDLGEAVFIPRAMLNDAGEYTLDDVTLEELTARVGVPVYPVATMSELVAALEGKGGRAMR